MSATTVNIIISGASVSGDVDTNRMKVVIDLGNSDKIGKIEFALNNKDGTYKAELVSGNATVQADVIQGGVAKTVFRGTLEQLDNEIDIKKGTVAHLTGYDYAQELLGLISPDSRQQSVLDSTTRVISVVSGEQGMGSRLGMDLALYVSGVVGSGAAGYNLGVTSGQPATTVSAFMSQYFGKSGDTTGSNSGLAFSFKPYLSGMIIWGTNPAYRTWYAQDGASDTNANYVITFDTLKAKHEYAWDVVRKLTRQSLAVDRSGYKVQFEVYVGVSGDINMVTSGTSNFISSGTLIYYQTGNSGSANNNVVDAKVPWSTTGLKNEIIGWFPVWSQYPFGDDWSDNLAYSGAYWSGGNAQAGTVTISGNAAAPGAFGFISIMGTNINANNAGQGGFVLTFTLWSGSTLNIKKWNVSGGNGVSLNYLAQPSADNATTENYFHNIQITDSGGNYIIKSGGIAGGANTFPTIQLVANSGWTQRSETIFKTDGTFNSGDGRDGGWAASATFPDLTKVKQLQFGFGWTAGIGGLNPGTIAYQIDNVDFQFAYNYSPVVILSSGSISAYGRRYEVFDFPYQVTDSGAAAVMIAELQGKSQSRQLAEFTVKDNPNVYPAQLNITPGQAFIVDAPSLNTGSGQTFYYWRATEVRHEWSHQQGFITYIKAYPWTSGGSAQSGQNLISYSLPLPAPRPLVAQQMPVNWYPAVGVG